MGTLAELINSLRASKDKSRGGVQKAVNSIKRRLVSELQAHSPRDTGFYASNWKASLLRFGQAGSLAGLTITNDTPGYGQFMEIGAPMNAAPWYYPQSKKTGRFRKSAKLKVSGGRVWAGGVSPGHDKTIGGAINKVMNNKDLWQQFTIDVSDEYVKGFV
jgi:hypothetical protein